MSNWSNRNPTERCHECGHREQGHTRRPDSMSGPAEHWCYAKDCDCGSKHTEYCSCIYCAIQAAREAVANA